MNQSSIFMTHCLNKVNEYSKMAAKACKKGPKKKVCEEGSIMEYDTNVHKHESVFVPCKAIFR